MTEQTPVHGFNIKVEAVVLKAGLPELELHYVSNGKRGFEKLFPVSLNQAHDIFAAMKQNEIGQNPLGRCMSDFIKAVKVSDFDALSGKLYAWN